MPGELSRSNPGPKGNVPLVPRWVPQLPEEKMSFDLPQNEDIHDECRKEIQKLNDEALQMTKEYTRMQIHFQEAVDRINCLKKQIWGVVDYTEHGTGRESFIHKTLLKIVEQVIILPRPLTGESPEVQGALKESRDSI